MEKSHDTQPPNNSTCAWIYRDLVGLWNILQPVKVQYLLLLIQVCIIGGTLGLTYFPLAFIGGADDEDEFYVKSYMYSQAHIFVFGVSKALTNIVVGMLSDKYGRRIPHSVGWVFGIVVPIMILTANNWLTVVMANIFLGLMQGITWSTDLFMMIDYAGAHHRGIAVGMNETIGYCAIAIFNPIAAALATHGPGEADEYRTNPYYLCLAMMVLGFVLCFFIQDTLAVVHQEADTYNRQLTPSSVADEVNAEAGAEVEVEVEVEDEVGTDVEDDAGEATTPTPTPPAPLAMRQPSTSPWTVFIETTFLRRRLVACCQAGTMINFLVGLAWTLLIKWMKNDFDIEEISGILLAFGIIRGVSQLFTGYLGDRYGRKYLIWGGLFLNALMLCLFSVALEHANTKQEQYAIFAIGAVFMGLGIGIAYPNLLAVVAEESNPDVRASALGTYRLWRDLGYALGAIISGALIDATGSFSTAVSIICGITFCSSVAFWILYGANTKPGAQNAGDTKQKQKQKTPAAVNSHSSIDGVGRRGGNSEEQGIKTAAEEEYEEDSVQMEVIQAQ